MNVLEVLRRPDRESREYATLVDGAYGEGHTDEEEHVLHILILQGLWLATAYHLVAAQELAVT